MTEKLPKVDVHKWQAHTRIFALHKACALASQITEQKDKDNLVQTTWERFKWTRQSYYQKLYKAQPPTAASAGAECQVLSYLFDKLSP